MKRGIIRLCLWRRSPLIPFPSTYIQQGYPWWLLKGNCWAFSWLMRWSTEARTHLACEE